MRAAEHGNTEAAMLLVDAGAAIDADDSEHTPLMLAAESGHIETVRALIAAGADVNAQPAVCGRQASSGLAGGSVA